MDYDIRGKRVYLSGPMSGLPNLNAAAFDKAQEELIALGAEFVFNPARAWGHNDREASWYMRHDLHRLTESDGGSPLFDVVVMLPFWNTSAGASLELRVARACGIHIINLQEVVRGD